MMNSATEELAAALAGVLKSRYGKAMEIEDLKTELSRVKIRKGTKLDFAPGDRVQITICVRLNREGRPGGFFHSERDADAIAKDDIVQVNENGDPAFIGALFQVASVSDGGVTAFCITSKARLFLASGSFEYIGPAAMVTPEDNPTEPMDHELSPEGEVIHPTQREAGQPGETSPMGHTINEEMKAEELARGKS